MRGTPIRNAGPVQLRRNRSGDDPRIQIKGVRDGLSVTLNEGAWEELLATLDHRLQHSAAFFRNSHVHLNTGSRDLLEAELEGLLAILKRHDIQLGRLHTSSRATVTAAQGLGLRIGLPEPAPSAPELPAATEQWSKGLLLHRTLRSGQSLRDPGHVVIVGSVHPGAEIVAGGDILVWGQLRGAAFAGASGNDSAVVCALDLQPLQLRIGKYTATTLDELLSAPGTPEVASVCEGEIVVRAWDAKVSDRAQAEL
jgi:septum site-determining protein MinC